MLRSGALRFTAEGRLLRFDTGDWSMLRIGQRLFAAITVRVQDVFDPYRPELHYMRGPGPRWRQKHGITARNRQNFTRSY
jgi:hypothetical protein